MNLYLVTFHLMFEDLDSGIKMLEKVDSVSNILDCAIVEIKEDYGDGIYYTIDKNNGYYGVGLDSNELYVEKLHISKTKGLKL